MSTVRAIRLPYGLFLAAVLSLFDLRVTPIVMYGICAVWKNFTLKNLNELNRIKDPPCISPSRLTTVVRGPISSL